MCAEGDDETGYETTLSPLPKGACITKNYAQWSSATHPPHSPYFLHESLFII